MNALPQDRRDRIERRGEEIQDEYLSLEALRKARKLTQKVFARKLKTSRDN